MESSGSSNNGPDNGEDVDVPEKIETLKFGFKCSDF
jgi:hypothetical protein